jgi:hypothetical protein
MAENSAKRWEDMVENIFGKKEQEILRKSKKLQRMEGQDIR